MPRSTNLMAKFNNKSTKIQLPDKPSALIRLAVNDITAVEKQKSKYILDMGHWHEPTKKASDDVDPYYENCDDKGRCAVCYAGSVMTQTLGANYNSSLIPEDFGVKNRAKLEALDMFREGYLVEAFQNMGLSKKFPKFLVGKVDVVDYEENPKAFKKQQLEIADTLEALGL